MSEQPAPGQLIWLRQASGVAYDAEVLQTRPGAVVLTRPADFPAFDVPQTLEALWVVGETLCSQTVCVDADEPHWVAVPTGATGPAQRRAHARVPVDLPMMLVCEHVGSEGVLVDMSEAGLRMRLVPDTAVPAAQAAVHCEVILDGEAFVLHGHVLRLEEGETGIEVVVVFDDVGGSTVTRIRRALFFEQIRLDVQG